MNNDAKSDVNLKGFRLSAEHLASNAIDCLRFSYEFLLYLEYQKQQKLPDDFEDQSDDLSEHLEKFAEDLWNFRSQLIDALDNVRDKMPENSNFKAGEFLSENIFPVIAQASLFWRMSQNSSIDEKLCVKFKNAENKINNLLEIASSELTALELQELVFQAIIVERAFSDSVSLAEAEKRERARWE